MIEAYFAIIIGLGLLTFGADRFVEGAAAAANNWGIPPLLVGLTVVGFATSAPEMLVGGVASLHGNRRSPLVTRSVRTSPTLDW